MQDETDPTTPDGGNTPPKPKGMKRVGAIALPAVVGAVTALAVLAGTGQLGGGDTTIIRETASGVTTSVSSARDAATEAESAVPSKGLSVAEVVKRESPAVVSISNETEQGGSLGSGFLIDAAGHIITNAHVVDGASKTTVTFQDGTEAKGTILGVDKSTDVAVVKIDKVPTGVSPLPLGNSGGLTVGQEVVAIGNPYGYSGTATTGIVSALERVIRSPSGFTIQNAIQTDAAINQGNSGGPLFDRDGRVIGINSQIASENGGNVGIGFAVPIDTVQPIVASIIASGTAQHAWIGIQGRELTPGLAEKLGLVGKRGVIVASLDDRGAANDAGMKAADSADAAVPKGGDLIVAINGQPITDMADVSKAVASRKVGDQITVTVLRDGKSETLTLTLKDRPADIGAKK
ncbi:MAG: S1C family serine protease [Miltoncostaeaceae bacterium]